MTEVKTLLLHYW